MCRPVLAALALSMMAAPAAAQIEGMPPGWRAITDTPGEFVVAGIEPNDGPRYNFVRMAPGWHITTGPGTLLFDPSIRATGNYRVETELFWFPNPGDQPLGLFIGGRGLDGPLAGVQWFGVLVRRDGSAAVIHNHGTDHHPVTAYRHLDSLPPHPVTTSQRLTLAVDVRPDSVRFSVNREPVGALPRGDLPLDGPFGFRVGRGQNLHVVRLDYTYRLAPIR